MTNRNAIVLTMIALLAVALLASCARYQQQVVPFKMPQAYPNSTTVGGAVIASKSWDDQKEAEAAFGFDIRPEILPVQVIFDNKGSHPLEIVSEQTFLIDVDNNAWPVMDARMAYDRIARKTELGEVAPNAAKYGALGAVAGGIIGAAIGIVGGLPGRRRGHERRGGRCRDRSRPRGFSRDVGHRCPEADPGRSPEPIPGAKSRRAPGDRLRVHFLPGGGKKAPGAEAPPARGRHGAGLPACRPALLAASRQVQGQRRKEKGTNG